LPSIIPAADSLRSRILAQPGNLVAAAGTFEPSLAESRPLGRGDFLVFTGMGASYFAVLPAAATLRDSGMRAFALEAQELRELPGPDGPQLVAVSNTGRSPETLRALEAHRGPAIAITNDGSSPLARAADVHLEIGSAPDPTISVQTYTASLLISAAVAAELSGAAGGVRAGELAEMAAELLERSDGRCRDAAERFAASSSIDFVGEGPAAAAAGEGALLFREACRKPSSWWSVRGYLHGALESAAEGTAHVIAGTGRAVALARDLVDYGSLVLLITADDVAATPGMHVVRIPDVHPALSPILEILPVQLLVAHLCDAWDITPERFVHPQDDTRLATP
jgi:glucosamine--fructose-6-phosphate aminotransferase (isomerizing)